MSHEWYLQPKKYLSGFELEEIESGFSAFDEFLEMSAEAYDVMVDDDVKRVIIQSTSDYNKRRILFKKDDFEWGDIILLEGEKWLVAERPFFNKFYSKSHIKFCNGLMVFKEEKRDVIGRDRLNNPIYGDRELIITEIPCVVESITNLKTPIGQQINIPNGDMIIEISNTDNELIEISREFEMFDEKYRIVGVDRSKTHNDKGVLILVVNRTLK